ncbi:MAG: DUF1192 family protein [Sphingomonadales bacterium]
MDEQDTAPRPMKGPLHEVEREDLERLSRDELARRIERLREEITRSERAIAAKGSLQTEAEGLFKK